MNTLYAQAGSNAFMAVLCVALALATASTKLAGLAWLVLLCGGLWAWWRHRSQPVLKEDAALASYAWLLVCLLALGFRTVAVLYWGETWEERHAELRLLLGAAGVYGLQRVQSARPMLGDGRLVKWATHSLALSCAIGLYVVLRGGRAGLTTNAIPWAGGMAMISIWLTHAGFLTSAKWWERFIWAMGALLGVLATLASETRGAYGVVIWVVLVVVWSCRRIWSHQKLWLGIMLVLMAAAFAYKSHILSKPVKRTSVAIAEFEQSQQSKKGAQNSSVGARLVLWDLAKQDIPKAFWWGYGQKQLLQRIHEWGQAQNSKTVMSLGHMHNQYLHDMMNHGLWGLASTLTYLTGLTGLGLWLLKRRHAFAGLTLGGVAFMHASTSLTNVNFAHNYYPTVMAVVVGLALMSIKSAAAMDNAGR